jgi:pantetheine-phosphate adenylyltransferase
MTTALFPGTFDPFHNGHLEVVERAQRLFDAVFVAVLRNPSKGEPLFPIAVREQLVAECVAPYPNVKVVTMSTLAVEVARQVGADVIVKGLRAVTDFENELQMAQMNQQISGIETVMLPTGSSSSFIASRLVREIAQLGGDVSAFVPEPVLRRMKEVLGA